MAVFSRIKTWVSNEILTAADLNGEFNNLLTNTKPQSIEDYSNDVSEMQTTTNPGGVGTEILATTLAGEIERLRYVLKRIVGAQWYSTPVVTLDAQIPTASIADSAVTTAKIADLNVTTGKIANGAITPAKLASVNYGASLGSASFSGSATSLTDVTGMSITMAVSRPMRLFIQAGTLAVRSTNGTGGTASLALYRDAVQLCVVSLGEELVSNAGTKGFILPGNAGMYFIDTPVAGTYVYKIQYLVSNALTTFAATNCFLIGIEE